MTDHRHSDPVITMDNDRKDDVGTVVGEKEKWRRDREQAPRSLRNGGNGSNKKHSCRGV